MYVEEKDRSWCTSSAANDNRAVTIEVANDGGADTGWHVGDKAMSALIGLCADICGRNGIKKLLWKGDKNLIGQVDRQNMTVHRWFANKSCPGDYLYGKHPYITDEVNKRLASGAAAIPAPAPTPAPARPITPYFVKITASLLNYRSGAGVNFPVKGTVKKGGVYTVVAESGGAGANKWGALKSGAGWISLDYAQKI
jgi:hypothetical protein